MALFDSIIDGVSEKFGLGDKAGTLLSALLALMTNQETGGFSGFLDRFKDAGLGDMATSWITSSDNAEVSDEQIETAIGSDTIDTISEQVGIERDKTTSALAFMTPKVVDSLTPDGEVPDDESLLSGIGGFLTGLGGAVGAVASGAGDKAEDAVGAAKDVAGAAADKVGDAAETVGDAAEAVGDKVSDTFNAIGGVVDGDGDGDGDGGAILKWLLPLILLGILLALGFIFFSGDNVKPVDTNKNTAETNEGNTAETNVSTEETNTSTEEANTSTNEAGVSDDAGKDEDRKLTEVTLSEDTKLQAYPGGIEDQLIKFIKSDEYKSATNESLKDKWFDFDDLNFKFGTTELAPESKRQLDNIVAILKAYPDVKIKIGGYTDKKGADEANKTLSDARAKAVKAALEKAGVGPQVPEAEGYGEEFAKVAEDASDEERASDRKTSIRLLK